MNPKTRDKQSIIVRGVAAAIQAMHTPTFENLREILNKFGWTVVRLDSSTNKQTDED